MNKYKIMEGDIVDVQVTENIVIENAVVVYKPTNKNDVWIFEDAVGKTVYIQSYIFILRKEGDYENNI